MSWDATFHHRLAKHRLGGNPRPARLYVGDREWAWLNAGTDIRFILDNPKGLKGAHAIYAGVRIIRCALRKHWHFTN